MPTLKQERVFENDAFGRTRPGAKMYFYEAGTNIQKNTYTDVALTSANPWPLVADGAGVFPQAFLESGGYKIVYTDSSDVQFDVRDNVNVAETTILSTSDFYFDNLVDAKLGASINGTTIDLQVGQIVRTAGKVTSTDGLGAEWIVVAAGTGTADDDLYADLDNGLQIKRLFNQLYSGRNLSEIQTLGVTAQNSSRDNLLPDVASFTKTSGFWKISNNARVASTLNWSSVVASGGSPTVGPTGSGATYEWSALDQIPTWAKSVRISADVVGTSNTGGNIEVVVTCAELSTSSVFYTLVRALDINTGDGATSRQAAAIGATDVILESDRQFHLKWEDFATTSSRNVIVTLLGFSA
jgi:hypothetical protein